MATEAGRCAVVHRVVLRHWTVALETDKSLIGLTCDSPADLVREQ